MLGKWSILSYCNDRRLIGHRRWLFLIEGVITVVIAFSAYWILPDFPHTTSWLTEQERQIAVLRLEEDTGVDRNVTEDEQFGFFHGFLLALKDPKTYLLMLILSGIVSSASVTNFFPTVVSLSFS